MKQFKDIKNRLVWEEYYNPDFNWNTYNVYMKNTDISVKFINTFYDKINWTELFTYHEFTYAEIRKLYIKHSKYFSSTIWSLIVSLNWLTFRFISEFYDKLPVYDLLDFQNFSVKTLKLIIEKYGDSLTQNEWKAISKYPKLTKGLIEKYKDKLDLNIILMYHNMPENWLIKNIDRLNWTMISRWQNLSEKFIEKYQDKVDWVEIFQCQELSKEFCKKFKYKIS